MTYLPNFARIIPMTIGITEIPMIPKVNKEKLFFTKSRFPNKKPKAWGPIPAEYARPLHLTIAWAGLNLALGFVGPGLGIAIAIWSHIGGFIAGLLLARPMLLWRYRRA
jgi:hypothetical protein